MNDHKDRKEAWNKIRRFSAGVEPEEVGIVITGIIIAYNGSPEEAEDYINSEREEMSDDKKWSKENLQ